MTDLLAKLLHRLLAAGLLGLTVAGAGWGVFALYHRYLTTESRIEESRLLLGRLEAAIAETRAPAANAETSEAAAGLMVPEESKGLAIAALQTQLSEIAQTVGLRLESAGELPAREDGPLTLIGLRLEISGGDEAVGRLLHGIETSRPMLVIEGARLSGRIAASAGQIDASIDVYAALEATGAQQP